MTIKEIKDLVREKVSNGDTEWLRGMARIVAGHTPRDGDYIAVRVPLGGIVYHYSVDDPELEKELRQIYDSTTFVKALWPHELVEGDYGFNLVPISEGRVQEGAYQSDEVYYDLIEMELERAKRFGLMFVCEEGEDD